MSLCCTYREMRCSGLFNWRHSSSICIFFHWRDTVTGRAGILHRRSEVLGDQGVFVLEKWEGGVAPYKVTWSCPWVLQWMLLLVTPSSARTLVPPCPRTLYSPLLSTASTQAPAGRGGEIGSLPLSHSGFSLSSLPQAVQVCIGFATKRWGNLKGSGRTKSGSCPWGSALGVQGVRPLPPLA